MAFSHLRFTLRKLALWTLLRKVGRATLLYVSLVAGLVVACKKTEGTLEPQFGKGSGKDGSRAQSEAPAALRAAVEMRFKAVPPGAFEMGGSSETDLPVHLVTLQEFQMSETEVVFGEWKAVREWAVGSGYDFDNEGSAESQEHPVVHVNWYDAVKWCNAKSEKMGLAPCYYSSALRNKREVYKRGQKDLAPSMVDWDATGYRLPTEAEWEKAARGGKSKQRYPASNEIKREEANFGSKSARSVGGFAPNGYGLFDMAGNVWEWCWDWHEGDAQFTNGGKDQDPRGPLAGVRRVVRGGGWDDGAGYCCVSFHNSSWPDYISDARGFRVVRR
jgi:formylglycine-generating enzyme